MDLASVLIVASAAGLLALRGLNTLVPETAWGRSDEAPLRGSSPRSGRISQQEFWALATSGHRIGIEDAPVTVVFFSDYACGFCIELNRTLEILLNRYPQHLALVVKLLTDLSSSTRFNVALGAKCAAEQGWFREYHNAALGAGELIEYSTGWQQVAEAAGIPNALAFSDCVRSRRLEEALRNDDEDAVRLGVRVTPTLFVNRDRVVGSAPLAVLDSIISSAFSGRRTSRAQH